MSGVKRFEAHYLTEGVMGGKALACAEMVLASDYDRDTQALRNQIERYIQEGINLADERDALRAQVQAMREALAGVLRVMPILPPAAKMIVGMQRKYDDAVDYARAALQEAKP